VEAACWCRTPRERPKLVQRVTSLCNRAFGSGCSIAVRCGLKPRPENSRSLDRGSGGGGVGSRQLRYESRWRARRINQPELMDPRLACASISALTPRASSAGGALTVVTRPLTLSVGPHAPPNRLQSSPAARGARRSPLERTTRAPFNVRAQDRSRSLGLEVIEPLPRTFRRLAEISVTRDPGAFGRLAGRTCAPVSP